MQQTNQPYVYTSNVTPRSQWDANFGYCGETSYICAGMSLGQYCSQWTARSLASYGVNQDVSGSQLMLGTPNALLAAREMKLQASAFNSEAQQDTQDFIVWVKSQLLAGGVPIIGVFNNCYILGEGKARNYGDGQFDHIVPIVGWASNYPLNHEFAGVYIADDTITLSDNGLYTPGNPPTPPFLFPYQVGSFQGTRETANLPPKAKEGGQVYTLKERPNNFGVVIEGVSDTNGVTIPVSLSSTLNHEPPMADGANTAPTAKKMELTATVTIPDQSKKYNVYLYTHFKDVPEVDFNINSPAPYHQIAPNQGATVTLPPYRAMSDQTVVFRAVPAGSEY